MFEPAYIAVSLVVSGVGFVMFMYGKKQHRPVQLASGLLLLIIPVFVRDALLLGVIGAAVCALAWGGVKAGL
jgi:hypothetical protein